MPRHAGHKAGVGAVRSTVEACLKHGIQVLTLFAFSSENWRRPQQEVGLLMDLFLSALQREARRLQQNGVRLRVIGERVGFSEKLQAGIATAEELTAGNSGLLLQIAANYGGRWDIVEAARKIARQVVAGTLDLGSISEDSLSEALSFPGVPDPDLYIRTGGERRLSNFLLWQAAYSELYFTPTLWPDFDGAAFDLALADYAGRQRRFGLTSEQLPASSRVDD